jgi:WD40 repeat protein
MSLAGRTVSNIELRKAVTDSLRLQMSGDGRYLAGVEDGTLWIWEAESGKVIQEIDLEPGEAALEFSPDGSQLLAVTRSKFELIKPADGKRITLDVPETHTMNVMFPPDGRIVVGASSVLDQDAPFVNGEPNFTSGALTVFDAETGKALSKVALENPIYTSAISPDGSRVAITGYDGGVSLWGLK